MSDEGTEEAAALIPVALRITHRLSAAWGVRHYADELEGVALLALARAHAGYAAEEGKLRPFALKWVSREVQRAARREAKRRETEAPMGDAAEGAPVHPATQGERLAREVMEALLSLFVDDELRHGGEAGYLTRETWEVLHQEVGRLSPQEQRLVDLRYWQGLTWSEVAAALGMGVRTAQEHDEDIRDRLRDALLAHDRVVVLRGRS